MTIAVAGNSQRHAFAASPGATPSRATRPGEPGAVKTPVLRLNPGLIYRLLLAAIALVFVAGVAAPLVYHASSHDGLRHLMLRFDPGQEANLPTWFASFLLLLAAASVLAVAALRHRLGERRCLKRWYLLAGIVLLAAIDETAGFHELLTPATKRFIETAGFFDNAWMIPMAAILLVLAVFYLPWLRSLPRRTARLVVLAGAIFVGGAMACEGAGSVVLEHLGPAGWPYALVVAAEESFENVGTATFVFAMLGLLAHTVSRVVVEPVAPDMPAA